MQNTETECSVLGRAFSTYIGRSYAFGSHGGGVVSTSANKQISAQPALNNGAQADNTVPEL